MNTCPVLDFVGPLRESIEARIRVMEHETLLEFAIADAFQGQADDHRCIAERKQVEVDRLTRELEGGA